MTARKGTARVAAAVVAAWAALAVVAATAAPASASSYRYWSYWHGTSSGGWSFSPVGATFRPAAGSVDGWRFAVSGAAASVQPRASASYDSICARHAAAPSGQKLVGLVVDYGTRADAPAGQQPPRGVDTYCAQVPDAASSAQVLVQYASVRSESGLVCAIDGYPVGECGVIVRPPTAKPSPQPTSHRPSPAPSAGRSTGGGSSPAAGSRVPAPVGATAPGSGPLAAAATTPGSPLATSGTSTGDDPQPVAVGAAGVRGPDDPGGGPPVGALVGAALVLVVGAAAALRALRGPRDRGPGVS